MKRTLLKFPKSCTELGRRSTSFFSMDCQEMTIYCCYAYKRMKTRYQGNSETFQQRFDYVNMSQCGCYFRHCFVIKVTAFEMLTISVVQNRM